MYEYSYPEFKKFIGGGISYALIFSTLYHAHLLRYSTPKILQTATKSVKFATKPRLSELTGMGYLVNHDGIFTSTSKTLDLLIKIGYNPELLPPVAEGRGAEIYTQEALSKLLLHPFYRVLLYPHFDYVIPDGLLILQDGSKYQLNFVEVERKKPNWAEYLEDKREKYNRLFQDEIVYQYWVLKSHQLGLICPSIDNFQFQVLCIGGIEFEWEGWEWKRKL